MPLDLLPLTAPLSLFVAAAVAFVRSGQRSRLVSALAEGAALATVVVALGALGLLLIRGPGTSPLIGVGGIGFSARLDAVSVAMLVLVSFVGWIVVRYARTYLDGEARQGAFTGWLCATIAAVLLLPPALWPGNEYRGRRSDHEFHPAPATDNSAGAGNRQCGAQ